MAHMARVLSLAFIFAAAISAINVWFKLGSQEAQMPGWLPGYAFGSFILPFIAFAVVLHLKLRPKQKMTDTVELKE